MSRCCQVSFGGRWPSCGSMPRWLETAGLAHADRSLRAGRLRLDLASRRHQPFAYPRGCTRRDRHACQSTMACPPRSLAHASRRPKDLRARLRGRRCGEGWGGEGLSDSDRERGMSDITPSDTQARAISAIKDWFENRTQGSSRSSGCSALRGPESARS